MSLNKKKGSDPFFQWIKNALQEDIGSGDITSKIIIPQDKKVRAALLLKERTIVCGLDIARRIFKAVDASIKFRTESKDGRLESPGEVIARIEGNARSILKAERTVLNLLSHLSGVATLTRRFVDAVKPYKAGIYDTRKTIPGLRVLEKYAVKTGGGYNHRMGLYDGILIKDNHIASCATHRSPSLVRELAEVAKKKRPKGLKVEIEVISLAEFKEALKARPDIIMLDNMKISDIKEAVKIRERQTLIEVSGGVSLANVKEIARTGVDIISIGSLTHSAKAVDISLEV